MFDIYAGQPLMGAFDVRQTARLVARYHYVEAQLMRVMAGKLASLPEWEVKCLLGLHLWHDSLHANDMLARLVDLRWPRKAPRVHSTFATLVATNAVAAICPEPSGPVTAAVLAIGGGWTILP